VNEFFSFYLILLAALGPGVYSASDRNEYQKQKNNISGEQSAAGYVGLTTLPPWPPQPVTGIVLVLIILLSHQQGEKSKRGSEDAVLLFSPLN
jgi:hypothetical protein